MGDVLKQPKRKIVAVELFCGCGGLTKGLRNAGIRVIKGIDMDKTAKKTYEKNNPSSIFVQADIKKMSALELMEGVDRRGADLLLAGCAPCQPFSKHTNSSGTDKRRSLMQCFADMISQIKPEYILAENVPGFQKNTNPYHTRFLQTLDKHGYNYDERIINAAEYGIPQSRIRYVLLGSKNHSIAIPDGSYGKGKRKFRTVRDAIEKYPEIDAGQSCNIPNHTARNLSERNLKRIKLTPEDGGSRRDIPEEMTLRCHREHSGHTDVYGRMFWDAPAPTLTCRCNSLSNGRFGHPVQNRAITVREAATIQTFPKGYVFYSCETRNAIHVGNAVPVLLAKKLGRVFTNLDRTV